MFIIRKIVDIIFEDEKDEEIKKNVGIMIKLLIVILIMLILLLLGSMLKLEFTWGIFDTDIMIAVIPTILGGYLGLLGAIIGVLGAYLILKKQLKIEREKNDNREILDFKMIKCLLEYTICETDDLIDKICEEYCKIYSGYLGGELLEFKVEDKTTKLSTLVSELVSYDAREIYMYNYQELYKNDNSFTGYAEDYEYVKDVKISNDICKNTYKNILKLIENEKDYKTLIYDKDWNKYVVAMKNSKYFDFDDIKSIIKWIYILQNNVIINDKKNNKTISEFIDIRDEMISLVMDKFKFFEESFDWDFQNSTEHIKSNMNNIEGIEIVTRRTLNK